MKNCLFWMGRGKALLSDCRHFGRFGFIGGVSMHLFIYTKMSVLRSFSHLISLLVYLCLSHLFSNFFCGYKQFCVCVFVCQLHAGHCIRLHLTQTLPFCKGDDVCVCTVITQDRQSWFKVLLKLDSVLGECEARVCLQVRALK